MFLGSLLGQRAESSGMLSVSCVSTSVMRAQAKLVKEDLRHPHSMYIKHLGTISAAVSGGSDKLAKIGCFELCEPPLRP